MAERTLRVTIVGDSSGAEKAFNKLDTSASRSTKAIDAAKGAYTNATHALTSRLGPAAGAAQGALDKMGDSVFTTSGLMKTALVGGAALGGAALAKFALDGVGNFVRLANEVRNFQRASGASAEEASRFVAVLDDMEVSSEEGAAALFRLGRTAAQTPGQLASIGVEIAKNADGSTNLTETLLNVADAYANTTDPARKAEIAFQAFGKRGQSLIPILEQGRQGLEGMFAGVREGQMFSQEDIDRTREYELAMDRFDDSVQDLQRNLGRGLVPALSDAVNFGAALAEKLDDMRDSVGGLGGIFGDFFPKIEAGQGIVGILGEKLGLLDKKGQGAAEAQRALEQSTKEAAEEADEARAKADAYAQALDNVFSASMSLVSSQVAEERTANNFKDAIADLPQKVRDVAEATRQHGARSQEAEQANRALRDANLGVREAALGAAGAAVRVAEDQAKANGTILTAEQKAEIFRAKLVELANQTSGPTKEAILGLTKSIVDVPTAKTIVFIADTYAAMRNLEALDRRIVTLPDGHVIVAADTHDATSKMQRVLDLIGGIQARANLKVGITADMGNIFAPRRQHTGGLIPGSGNQDTVPAMLTPGEYVIRKAAVSKLGPDYLEWLNATGGRTDYATGGLVTGRLAVRVAGETAQAEAALARALEMLKTTSGALPGGGGGNIVGVGRQMQRMGYRVGEHPAFGGVAPVHVRNSYHYRGRAIDVNWPGAGETGRLDWLHGWIRANVRPITELLWRTKGHFGHLHLAMNKGGLVPTSFDNGGVLRPGLTLAANNTGRNEYVSSGSPTVVQHFHIGTLVGSDGMKELAALLRREERRHLQRNARR